MHVILLDSAFIPMSFC